MKTVLGALGATLAIAVATPAAAALVQYQYQGSVADVFGPDPLGVVAGDQVHVTLRYDTAYEFDVTAAANAAYGTFYGSIKAATLNTPGAFLHIKVGSDPVTGLFAGSDQFPFAADPFGTGGNPYVLFKDGGFFGVSYFGVMPGLAAFVTAGAAPEFYDFVGGSFKVGAPSYGGFFNYDKAIRTDGVPEPAAWSLMIAGFGMAGTMLRRRRRSAASLLAFSLAMIAASGAAAEPDKPKPKDDVAIAAGQAGQAEVASTAQGSSNGRAAIIGVLHGTDSKAAQKKADQKKAAPAKILPYIEHK